MWKGATSQPDGTLTRRQFQHSTICTIPCSQRYPVRGLHQPRSISDKAAVITGFTFEPPLTCVSERRSMAVKRFHVRWSAIVKKLSWRPGAKSSSKLIMNTCQILGESVHIIARILLVHGVTAWSRVKLGISKKKRDNSQWWERNQISLCCAPVVRTVITVSFGSLPPLPHVRMLT